MPGNSSSTSAYNQLLIAHITSKMIFMNYLPPVRPKMFPKLRSKLSKFDTSTIYHPISILMSKIFFQKHLPPIKPKLVSKLKSRSRLLRQILFLLNIYRLGPNWSQTEKCSEFIKIWHIWYFKYANPNFDVKNDFYEIFTTC